MIQITRIKPPVVEHFSPNDESLGYLNEYESVALRTQIVKEQPVGNYYYKHNDRHIFLDNYGVYEIWPKEYTLMGDMLKECIQAQMSLRIANKQR